MIKSVINEGIPSTTMKVLGELFIEQGIGLLK